MAAVNLGGRLRVYRLLSTRRLQPWPCVVLGREELDVADTIDPTHRSRVMATIRSKGTKLEQRMEDIIRRAVGRRGLEPQPECEGQPDFLRRTRARPVAIFVDSCYWHGCSEHLRMPASNVEYWKSKIERNRGRDIEVTRQLETLGYHVLRIWEHELVNEDRVVSRIRAAVEYARRARRLR